MSTWLIRKKAGRTILGPFSNLDVAEKLKAGEVDLDDYICEEGFATWTTLDKRKELTKLSTVDTQAERRKSLAKVDSETGSEEIVLEEETPGVQPDVDKKSRTWIRWLALGVVSVAALLIIRFQLTPPMDGQLTPSPAPKTPELESQQDIIRSRRPTQPSQNQLDPNVVPGISRFTTIDPTEPAPQEQTGGTLLEEEEGARKRLPDEPSTAEGNIDFHEPEPPPPSAEENFDPPRPESPPAEAPEGYEPPEEAGPPPPEVYDEPLMDE